MQTFSLSDLSRRKANKHKYGINTFVSDLEKEKNYFV